jgi:Ca-activated chloride channel family protein
VSVPDTEVAVAPLPQLVSTDGRTYPLQSAQLTARAEGGFATSALTQVFTNPHAEPLEVVYTLPLPVDGAVLGYTITVGERVIRGEIQTREVARRKYLEALEEGRVAGLLEQERAATFEQSLGNIPPLTPVQVVIDVVHPLAFLPAGPRLGHAASWEYRFPTVAGVRYSGAEGRVADAAQVSPDRSKNGTPTRMNLALTIGGSSSITGLTSRSHTLVTDDAGVISFAQGEALDRDVVVSWDATTQDVGVSVVEGGGLPGDDGRYVLVTVVPPSDPSVVFSRELTILLDTSGSMQEERLALATRVVADLLRSLEPQDTFELLTFASHVERLTPGKGRLPATAEQVKAALAVLAQVRASGGTELGDALQKAFDRVDDASQRQVVLLTDGDVNFEAEIVGRVAATSNARLHVVAIGEAPNRALTQQAAAAGRGLELLVSDEASAARAAERLTKNTASPVLVQVEIEGTAVVARPEARLRDVFAGQPLVTALEVSPQGGTIEVRGLRPGSCDPWVYSLELPHMGIASKRTVTSLPVGALFGRECVTELELQHAAVGYSRGDANANRKRLENRIEKVALRHRIVSRRTSLVAIAEDVSADPTKPRRKERIAVELPRDVAASQFFGEARRFAPPIIACRSSSDLIVSSLAKIAPSASTRMYLSAIPEVDSGPGEVIAPMPHFEMWTPTLVEWLPSGQLALEFVMPAGKLPRPSGRARLSVVLRDEQCVDHFMQATFDGKASSDLSLAKPGETVRLVFKVKEGDWIPGAEATFMWRPKKAGNEYVIEFTVPARGSERGR